MEQALQHRRTVQPPAEPEESITLLEGLRLFKYGYQDSGPLGIRPGDDGERHIVVTWPRAGKSDNPFDQDFGAWLGQLAPAFDAEWQAAGCMRLILLDRDEAAAAVEAIDRGDLEYRGRHASIWWGNDDAAKHMPYTQLALIDSTARVLCDQGETVNSLADLRALLAEALCQDAAGALSSYSATL